MGRRSKGVAGKTNYLYTKEAMDSLNRLRKQRGNSESLNDLINEISVEYVQLIDKNYPLVISRLENTLQLQEQKFNSKVEQLTKINKSLLPFIDTNIKHHLKMIEQLKALHSKIRSKK